MNTDLRKAKLELGRLKAEEATRKPLVKDPGFAEFAEEFLELYSKPNKRSWRRDQFSIKSLSAFFGSKRLGDITAHDVERFKTTRLGQTSKRGTQLSPASVNRELACLRTLLNKAIEWGRLEESPVAKVRKLRESPPRERILTAAEEARLISKAAPHLCPILVTLLNTGFRRGEAFSLRWEDIDFDQGFIHVGDSKSGKSRNVPMNATCRRAMEELRLQSASELVFNGVREVKRSFRTACRRAGIKGLRLHDLRHTFASRLVQAGVDLVTVSKLLGHSSIQMTMRYAHPTPENMKRAVERLVAILDLTCQKNIAITVPKPKVSQALMN